MLKTDKNILKKFRPSATPLITVDPYFSIWSMSDELYGDYTRHWTGRINSMFAGVTIDGAYYSLMGIPTSRKNVIGRLPVHIPQKSLVVSPLKTTYIFENDKVRVTLEFLTPLLLNRLDILSRTASYIEYSIEVLDNSVTKTTFMFGISGECAVDTWEQDVKFGRSENSVYVGNAVQNVLAKSGDGVCIEWGYLHLADKNAKIIENVYVNRFEKLIYDEADEEKEYKGLIRSPYIFVEKSEKNGVITLGYDEVYPIEYFGKRVSEYYKKYFTTFEKMLSAAVREYAEIKELCRVYDEKVIADTLPLGEKYMRITSLAFRQAIAAHKLIEDEDGNIVFLSKECYSNGCIGTLDITYPSIPLFLKYNPELVHGMLRPIIKYAESDNWNFSFAPHDVGQFPKANGQYYYDNKREYQMPVEECGNMLISVAAVAKVNGDYSFAIKNREILKKWADYLIRKGLRPENQLCTDDFAGHLEENCNLSIKGIIGIAAFGHLFSEQSYIVKAKELAELWEKEAVQDYGSKLAFNLPDTWSIKYNMVWDKLLGYGLFSEVIYKKETELYMTKFNRFGVPLDCRDTYTKMDWLFWSTKLCGNEEYFNKAIDSVYDMICTTEDRNPMNDWYDSVTGKQCEFQNRSVVGGIFINLL